MIRIILQTSYLYGLLPLLIGYAITSTAKRHISFPSAYVSGYVVYLALFEVLTIWQSRHASYIRLAHYWTLTIYLITIIMTACVICNIIRAYRKGNGFSLKVSREAAITIIMTLVLVLLAVLFLVPHALDDTPELARLTIANDSFFSNNPATRAPYADSSVCPGCLHLFYTFGSTITGLNVTVFIHILLPIFMIPFLVCSYVSIAKTLFPAERQSSDRFRFVWLILLFYALMLPLEAHIAFAPYRNIWNGITLTSSCLFPLFITICVRLVRLFSGDEAINILSLLNALIGLLCLALSIRLCVNFGLIICSLFILASIVLIAVYLFRRNHAKKSSAYDTEGGGCS